jgi:hypothetical protein
VVGITREENASHDGAAQNPVRGERRFPLQPIVAPPLQRRAGDGPRGNRHAVPDCAIADKEVYLLDCEMNQLKTFGLIGSGADMPQIPGNIYATGFVEQSIAWIEVPHTPVRDLTI